MAPKGKVLYYTVVDDYSAVRRREELDHYWRGQSVTIRQYSRQVSADKVKMRVVAFIVREKVAKVAPNA